MSTTVVMMSAFTVPAKDGCVTTAAHFGQIVGNVGGATVSGMGDVVFRDYAIRTMPICGENVNS